MPHDSGLTSPGNKRILTEEKSLRDLRHLATEIFPLVREPHASLLVQQQVALLSHAAWSQLRDCGPVFDGYNGYFRALPADLVQCLNYDEQEGAIPGRVLSVLDCAAWPMWLCLQTAEACSERRYAAALMANEAALAHRAKLQQAEQA